MSEIIPYSGPSSSKKPKVFCPHIEPKLLTESAQNKYDAMKYNFLPGASITFHSNPDLLVSLKKIGWDCLVIFSSRQVYPELVSEFYAHMEFLKDAVGTLHSITTYVQGQKIILDQTMLLEILNLDPHMLDLPKINQYVTPIDDTVINCLNFKFNLATASNQFVPACLFDTPVSIHSDFLTPKCQFLSKILRHNFMPVRFDKKVHPSDLEIMKGILHESMNVNLPYFLLTNFEHCYEHNCMGYGLLLTKVFQYLDFDLVSPYKQTLKTSNLIAHVINPPKPLYLFEPTETAPSGPTNMESQLSTLSNMVQFLCANQAVNQQQMQDLISAVQTIQSTLSTIVEQQGLQQYYFGASADSVQMDPFKIGNPIPPLNTPLSPIDLNDV